MSAPWKKFAVLATAAGLASVSVGCGSTPPCEIDISVVDSARSNARSADDKLGDAKSQRDRLQKELASEQARTVDLESRKAELAAQLAELEG